MNGLLREGGKISPAALLFVSILLLWQLGVGAAKLPAYILPTPTAVGAIFLQKGPMLWRNSMVTLEEFLFGFGTSVLIGVPLGIATAKSQLFSRTLYPLLVASQSVPKLALAPLFTVWFGFGLFPKVVIAFLIAFFPITVSTVVGLTSVDESILVMARSIGLTPSQRFLKIELPASLPTIFSGLKIATTFSVIGAVVGEFLGADAGLGRVALTASTTLDTTLLFADLAILAFFGLVSYGIVALIERLVVPWQSASQDALLSSGL
jgi:NitT/TauT family transport system permease protein